MISPYQSLQQLGIFRRFLPVTRVAKFGDRNCTSQRAPEKNRTPSCSCHKESYPIVPEGTSLLYCFQRSAQSKLVDDFLGTFSSCRLLVMLLSHEVGGKTHYEIIGAKEDASQEEIRRTYRSAILTFHPDKLQKSSETSTSIHKSENDFLEVQRAWEILGNPQSRALYDIELRSLRQDAVASEDVNLDDMDIEDDGSFFELYYPCRCGDFFSIDSSELAEMGYPCSRNGGEISLQPSAPVSVSIILPCGSCSLKIRLLIDANVKPQTKSE